MPSLAIWAIAAAAVVGVIVRPFRLQEAVSAIAGAVLIVVLGLLPVRSAAEAVVRGTDVYLFLAGMMLLAEAARREGLFDWLAAGAVNAARGSTVRLFLLIYLVGVAVTAILSNDATAVVLTPAVFAAARKARVDPLPHLLACALVANAASFLLPISNPANLVVYDGRMPRLGVWLAHFLLPSILAIAATYVALYWSERHRLRRSCAPSVALPPLTRGGRTALAGILLTALALLAVSTFGASLGLPTAIMGAGTAAIVLLADRASPWPLVKDISWSILPLVAGLFVLVDAVAQTGLVATLSHVAEHAVHIAPRGSAPAAGAAIALAVNLTNNLPAGLVAGTVVAQGPPALIDSVLIGVDLGPNLSVTGSLATILWLTAIRREGEDVTFWRFLKVGAAVMPPALLLALGARLALS
ncbi:MAG TPA: arsenic transporter [Rhizomicrobium sp.]|nr:arsenic transporter [Rhizomicrobium sp.]